jgi:phage shock protein C
MNQIGYQSAGSENARSATTGLHLRRRGSMITGVCSGIAEYLGADVTLVRLGVVALIVTTGWAIAAYIAAAFIIPPDACSDESSMTKPLFEGQEFVKQMKQSAAEVFEAAARKDMAAFCHCWNEQIVNIRRAWMDALHG